VKKRQYILLVEVRQLRKMNKQMQKVWRFTITFTNRLEIEE
jgi:hypothetical protein